MKHKHIESGLAGVCVLNCPGCGEETAKAWESMHKLIKNRSNPFIKILLNKKVKK